MRRLLTILVGFCIFLSLLFAAGPAFSQAGPGDDQPENRTDLILAPVSEDARLDSILNQLLAVYEDQGLEAAREFAARNRLSMQSDQVQATVLATGRGPELQAVMDAVVRLGGRVQTWWGDQVQVLLPLASLRDLARQGEVAYLRRPLVGEPEVTSEGDNAIHASTYRSVVGTSGAGVKVAILDSGFQGYPALQTSGELPSPTTVISFRADGIIDGITNHGSACAEIVYDIAPGATYYLVNYQTDTEFYNAVDYLEAQGVQVVTHSISWFQAGPYDGSSSISQRIDTAQANGILWANSAGNRAQQHWEGNFNGDANNYQVWDIPTGANVNQIGLQAVGTPVTVYLSWNDWSPYSANDYNLYLLRWSGGSWVVEASSTTVQNGTQPPIETISTVTSQTTYYGILVHKLAGSARYLELFTTRQNLQFPVAMGSLPNAADAAGAVSSGAVDVSDYSATGLETFSSRGPTNANGGGAPDYANGSRTKPDLSSPDYVSTVTYGALGFGGTSSASPHTGGAAVLYIAGYQNAYGSPPTPVQTQAYLENCAESTYDWGVDTDGIKNNDFGAGGLYMCQKPTALRNLELSAHSPNQRSNLAMAGAVALLILLGAGLVARRGAKN